MRMPSYRTCERIAELNTFSSAHLAKPQAFARIASAARVRIWRPSGSIIWPSKAEMRFATRPELPGERDSNSASVPTRRPADTSLFPAALLGDDRRERAWPASS
jgi:hypothetical protein